MSREVGMRCIGCKTTSDPELRNRVVLALCWVHAWGLSYHLCCMGWESGMRREERDN